MSGGKTSDDMVGQSIQYVKRNTTTISQSDLRVWELVSDVPKLSIPWAYACAILNVILAGSGTILSSYLGDANLNKTQLIVGLLQMLTSVYLVGWFLSIYWAYKLIMAAGKSGDKPLTNGQNIGSQNVPGGKTQYNPYG